MVVFGLRDTSSFQYFGFPPSRAFFCIPAASFTRGLVDPAVDPACLIFIFIVVVVVVGGGDLGEQALDSCESVVVVVTLPLDSFRWPGLGGVKCSHELHVKVWGSSERGGKRCNKWDTSAFPTYLWVV